MHSLAPPPVIHCAGPWPASLANHSTASVVRAGLNRFDSLPPQLADPSGGSIDVAELPLVELDLSYNNLTVSCRCAWLFTAAASTGVIDSASCSS